MVYNQRHILRDRRRSTTACPSLLGDVNKLSEIVSGYENKILYWADQSGKGRTKISCTVRHNKLNQPTKEGPLRNAHVKQEKLILL